jgi:hypothetical protein
MRHEKNGFFVRHLPTGKLIVQIWAICLLTRSWRCMQIFEYRSEHGKDDPCALHDTEGATRQTLNHPLYTNDRLEAYHDIFFYYGPFLRLSFSFLNRQSNELRTGGSGFLSWRCKIFLFSVASKPVLGPTQPPAQLVSVALATGVKRPGREAHHLTLTSVKIKIGGDIPTFPNTSSSHVA